MTRLICSRLAVSLLLFLAGARDLRAAVHGYERLSDWDAVAMPKTGMTAGVATTYDRQGGNDDFCYYESLEGCQFGVELDNVVVTEVTGPGVLTRFQMPHAAADERFKVKMTIDGTVRIDTDSNALLGGNYGYMSAPLVNTLIGGQYSYEPIVFQDSLKIESNNYAGTPYWARNHHYYQYGYHRLQPGTVVTPYMGALTAEQQQARDAVENMIAQVGANPAGSSASAVVLPTGPVSMPAQTSLSLGSLNGSGAVRRLNLLVPGATNQELDGLRLRVRYDGRPGYAIDVPASHFFGAGHDRVPYSSLPLGTEGPDGFYCYWPMPYRQGIDLELYNATDAPVSIGSAAVEYEPKAVSPYAGYLHAVHNEQVNTAPQAYHTILSLPDGRGHFVGNLLYLEIQGTYVAILEGDDIIVVDGTRLLHGTGLEDGFNGGYYYNHVLEQYDEGDVPNPTSGIGPYSGLLRMNFNDLGDDYVRTDQYRWYIGDVVPFTGGIEVKVERYYTWPGVLFGSTAFYYSVPDLLLGDANEDGTVDTQDFTALKAAFGKDPCLWAEGNFNADTLVDIQDFTILKAHFGEHLPEPGGLCLLALGGVVLIGRRRR